MTLRPFQIVALAMLSGACSAGAGAGGVGALLIVVITAAVLAVACGPKRERPNSTSCLTINACLSPDNSRNVCLTLNFIPGSDMGPDVPDASPDATTGDGGGDTGTDSGDGGVEMGALGRERREILARLDDRLPADVAARLRGDDRGEA